MFESIFSESLSSKPFYKLLPQNENTDWSQTININGEEMTDIDLSAMEFNSYSVSKYCFKKKESRSVF